MAERRIWLLVACLALSGGQAARAQTETRGLIVRVADRLVFIDLGQRNGVQVGDAFDILGPEAVMDSLSGDTLAVAARKVGILRVRQVFEKMSLAELLQLQPGVDPMLMEIVRARNAPPPDDERPAATGPAADQPPPAVGIPILLACVPGLYQLESGHWFTGLSLAVLEGGTLAGGIALRRQSDDWYDRYRIGKTQADSAHYLDGARHRRRWSNRLFWTAGALYACNWIEALWIRRQSAGIDVGASGDGRPLLRMVYRF
jgi:hypothetical protein